MKRCILTAFAALFLVGCTDIRKRLSPDLLAADLRNEVTFAAHTSQDDSIITANAPDFMLLPDALRNAAGAEISTGHLTMLAVSGAPCRLTEQYLQAQFLAPTCTVLTVPQNACARLQKGTLPTPAMIQAAVDTGMLPSRTADTVVGDLWGGSGVTAFYAYENDALTLSLWADDTQCGSLSQDACRGLALFCGRYRTFSFAAGGTVYRIAQRHLHFRTEMTDRLHITVSGLITAEPPLTDAAAHTLNGMLSAAMDETICKAGADLLFLRETAVRDGIPDAADSTHENWRIILQNAVYEIRVSYA